MSTDATGLAPEATSDAPEETTGATKPEDKEATPKPKASPKAKDAAQKVQPQAKGPSPWETELAERGLDDPKFAEYMRDKQGYITQLEQSNSAFKQLFGEGEEAVGIANIAANVIKGLEEDPAGTISEIMRVLELDPVDLFGDPNDIEGYDEGDYEDEGDYDEEPDPVTAWVSQKMQAEQEAQQDAAYDAIIAQIKQQHGGFNDRVFHNYVIAYDGDIQAAYTEYAADFPPQIKAQAPPVIGGGSGQLPPQPQKQYNDFGGAVDDFMAEMKASRRR